MALGIAIPTEAALVEEDELDIVCGPQSLLS